MRYYLALMLLLSAGVGTGQAAVLRLYVAPAGSGGDDHNNGSRARPVATLMKVQRILSEDLRLCNGQQTNEIEVHITPGTYQGNPVSWTCFTGAPITFTSLDFGSARPVFDGGGVTHTWFAAEDPHGTQGKLYFRYLKVQNFSTALSFRRVGGNYLYGMYLYRIGGKYGPLGCDRNGNCNEPTAAVAFAWNSSGNRVANSHFINIENRVAKGALHAFYISDYSSANEIERNRFAYVSGIPIKVRNNSNYNRASANVFTKSGDSAFFYDGFDEPNECPSWMNEFTTNQLYDGYSGQRFANACRRDQATPEILGRCGWFSGPRITCTGNVQY